MIFIIKTLSYSITTRGKRIRLIFEKQHCYSCKIQTLDMHISTNSNTFKFYILQSSDYSLKILDFPPPFKQIFSHHIRNNSIFLFYFQIAITPLSQTKLYPLCYNIPYIVCNCNNYMQIISCSAMQKSYVRTFVLRQH